MRQSPVGRQRRSQNVAHLGGFFNANIYYEGML